MSGTPIPDDFRDLVDGYCDDLLAEPEIRRLEAILLDSPEARRAFSDYVHFHGEIRLAVRAEIAADAALAGVAGPPRSFAFTRRLPRWGPAAAALLIAAAAFLAGSRTGRVPAPAANVAWLVNAQDCLWAGADADAPGRDMRAGKVLRLVRGLAQVEFGRGAAVILQGPAELQLVSDNEAKLLRGRLTARVPEGARGFRVDSPEGRVVDLGTEFGVTVDGRGTTEVRVFRGEVTASAGAGKAATSPVRLVTDQAANIGGAAVAVRPHAPRDPSYVRAIVPPPTLVPRERRLDFGRPAPGTLLDAEGDGTGLTHRLPGTGSALPDRDPNLRLDSAARALRLTTTRSDLNFQAGLPTGEYLGLRLADLGFTGDEDFAVTATVTDIPSLDVIGQFGLYAGPRKDANIRGGLISRREPDRYGLFLVNDDRGRDRDLHVVGLADAGSDLRFTLKRVAGVYSLVVENLTTGSSSTLRIAHPAYLDGERDLFVGLFGANTRSDLRKTLTIKDFSATVWTREAAGKPVDPAAPSPRS